MDDRAGFDPSELYIYRGEGSVPRNVRRVEVDRSVRFIPARLFECCDQLESVLLHDGLLGIGGYAFSECSSLRRIQIPSTVFEIGYCAFRYCSSLEEVELPEGLEQIHPYTFFQCTSLEAIRIPASVTQIGGSAFRGCINLALVDLREGLRIIVGGAFDNCRSLGSLSVPPSVDEIGVMAFDDCSGLTLVQVHEDLPKMKRFAFRGCTSLESFRFVRLSERREAISMGDQMTSMFESRLNEIKNALTRDQQDGEAANAIWENCKESLGRAHEVLTYLELKGAVPVLELALWKGKIDGERSEGVQGESVNNEDGGQDPSDEVRERKRHKVTKKIGQDTRLSRRDCRVKCGAGIVMPEVLKFFTYRSSWPRMDDSEEGNVD